MKIEIPYGDGVETFDLAEIHHSGLLLPGQNDIPPA